MMILHTNRDRTLRASQAGFTLVELMIALAAGLLVASAAFLLARNASSFFQHEARISAAQYGAMVGLGRLQADLQRAAFLSSPNVKTDPHRCGEITTPAALAQLAGIYIDENGSYEALADTTLSDLNGLKPDSLVIGGSFATAEQFGTRGIFATGGGVVVYLQVDDGPMARLKASVGASALDDVLGEIFADGRFLRIVDDEGRTSFGQIATPNGFTGGAQPQIRLDSTVTVPSKATTGVCGYGGLSVGALVNPVSRVRYAIRSISSTDANYGTLITSKGRHSGGGTHAGVAEAPRTELVRVELKSDNTEDASTLEVVAEYAVDLKFGVTVGVPNAGTNTMALTRHAIGAAGVYTAAGLVTGGALPERIRAVQVRLITRGTERDRDVTIPKPIVPTTTTARGLFRFNLGADAGGNALGHVRVRSLVADVALPNQAGVTW
jgi:prepilin-type N-terminal cleavage/methylation domain-containing protein